MEGADPGKTIFRLLELNVMCDYSDRSDLAELVSGENPDFIVFTEYSPSAHRSMSEKEISKYPWHYEIYDGDHTGIGCSVGPQASTVRILSLTKEPFQGISRLRRSFLMPYSIGYR